MHPQPEIIWHTFIREGMIHLAANARIVTGRDFVRAPCQAVPKK